MIIVTEYITIIQGCLIKSESLRDSIDMIDLGVEVQMIFGSS